LKMTCEVVTTKFLSQFNHNQINKF